MQGIKLYHYFYVGLSSDQPGVMFVRKFSISNPELVQLCISSPPVSLPPIIPPPGLRVDKSVNFVPRHSLSKYNILIL